MQVELPCQAEGKRLKNNLHITNFKIIVEETNRESYQIMNLMIPSTRHKDNFILFLSTFQPDGLHMKHGQKEYQPNFTWSKRSKVNLLETN